MKKDCSKFGRTILTALLLLFFAPIALAEDVVQRDIFDSVKVGTVVPILYKGTYNHRITWTGSGTRTSCSIKLVQRVTSTSAWSDLIAAQDCTTDGAATGTGYANYVALQVTVLTGTGNTVYARYDGTSAGAGTAVTASQTTSPWIVAGGGTAGVPGTAALTVQGIGSGTPMPVSGTFWQTTQPVSIASMPSTPVTGTFWQTTQPISSANLDLAQGAAIASKVGPMVQGSVTTAAPAYVDATIRPISLDESGNLRVSSSGTATVTQGTAAAGSGAWPVTVTDTSNTVVKPGDAVNNAMRVNIVAGVTSDVAEGSAAGTTPALIGYQAASVEATAVDAADAIKARATLVGAPLHWGPALPGDTAYYYANVTDDDEDTIKAGAASTYLCVTSVFVQNADASTAATYSFKSDTSGTVIFAGYAGVSGGGFARGDGNSPIFCTASGKGLYAIASAHANLHVHVKYFRTLVVPSY